MKYDGSSTWTEDTVSFEIIDTVTFLGEKYYRLTGSICGSQYVRADSNFIYLSAIPFDLTASAGTLYYADSTNTVQIYVSSIDTIEVFGCQSRCISYGVASVIFYSMVLSDRFGPIQHSWYETGYEDYYSFGCFLSGVPYGTPLSVFDEINLAENFKLFQNYPNPFNPSTKIKYTVPGVVNDHWSMERGNEGEVKLIVYDILGREIETLVNEDQAAGTYEVNWNASGLPSGVYFYKLQAGDYIQTNKMLLLK